MRSDSSRASQYRENFKIALDIGSDSKGTITHVHASSTSLYERLGEADTTRFPAPEKTKIFVAYASDFVH